MMKLKIDAYTPKGQGKNAQNKVRNVLLGATKEFVIIHEEVIKNNHYILVIDVTEKAAYKIMAKCAVMDASIRKSYKLLISTVERANKLCKKFKKGTAWARRWVGAQLTKHASNPEELLEQMESLTDDQFTDSLIIEDKEEVLQWLKKPKLIDINVYNE